MVAWLTPPYLYFVINSLIISIVASSRFHKSGSDNELLGSGSVPEAASPIVVKQQFVAAPVVVVQPEYVVPAEYDTPLLMKEEYADPTEYDTPLLMKKEYADPAEYDTPLLMKEEYPIPAGQNKEEEEEAVVVWCSKMKEEEDEEEEGAQVWVRGIMVPKNPI